jgi:putative transposase
MPPGKTHPNAACASSSQLFPQVLRRSLECKQFTSEVFTRVLLDHRIEVSMDGRGRCHDNIFVERLWWTVKHEWVYLRPAADGLEQKRSLAEFFDWYNRRRPHQALSWQTPDEAYFGQSAPAAAAAA